MKRNSKLIDSFNYAVRGIIRVLKRERNMKIHFGLACLVLIAGLLFNISRLELSLLFITVTLVIFAEMINTAVEKLADLFTSKYHPQVEVVKDIAAGAVLITAINALIIGYMIFYNNFSPLTLDLLHHISQTPIHLTFISLVVVMLVVIASKAYFQTENYFQGGLPSGHAAVAFCLVIIISLLTGNTLVTTLVLFLAFLVAESRVEGKIHSIWEVVLGGIIGSLVGLLIFQLMQL